MPEINITQTQIDQAIADARRLRAQFSRDLFTAMFQYIGSLFRSLPSRARTA